eukprot:m51a1_g13618 hypothetical protein (266) ;mRNA; f:1024-2110
MDPQNLPPPPPYTPPGVDASQYYQQQPPQFLCQPGVSPQQLYAAVPYSYPLPQQQAPVAYLPPGAVPYPAYSAQPLPPASLCEAACSAVVQQQQQQPPPLAMQAGAPPAGMGGQQCPHCGQFAELVHKVYCGFGSHTCCFAMFFALFFPPFVCLPLCMPGMKDERIVCRACKKTVAYRFGKYETKTPLGFFDSPEQKLIDEQPQPCPRCHRNVHRVSKLYWGTTTVMFIIFFLVFFFPFTCLPVCMPGLHDEQVVCSACGATLYY